MHDSLGLHSKWARQAWMPTETLQFFCASAIICGRNRSTTNAKSSGIRMAFSQVGNAMDALWDIVVSVGHAIEQVLIYVETHHWIFGFLAGGYIFYLHDRGLHARFDALDKRIDEIRKRLAVEY
jgi:hypothetical protein